MALHTRSSNDFDIFRHVATTKSQNLVFGELLDQLMFNLQNIIIRCSFVYFC